MIVLWCKIEQTSVHQWKSRDAAIKGIVVISHTKVQLTRGGFLNPWAAANNMKTDSRKTSEYRLWWILKNLIGVEYPQVFFREGQVSSSELHAHSLMAAVVSSQEVPLFRCGLRSQHGSCAASTRSVNCAAALCEMLRPSAGPAAGSRGTVFCFMLTLFWHRWHFDTVMESLNLLDCLFGNVLSSLLHRTSLRYAGCCASSLWSVLLLLPSPAVHLLWHVQTHISRWESRLKDSLFWAHGPVWPALPTYKKRFTICSSLFHKLRPLIYLVMLCCLLWG